MTDAWLLRTCRDHPWRTFLAAWLAALIVVIAPTLPGAVVVSRAAPTVHDVPYADLIEEHGDALAAAVGVPAEALPADDPTAAQRFAAVVWDDGAAPPRIVVHQTRLLRQGTALGYDWLLSDTIAHDATDPRRDPVPAGGVFGTELGLRTQQIGISIARGDGSAAWSVGLPLPGALVPLAMPLALAAMLVLPARAIDRAIRRRRRRRGACTWCGQLQDPNAPSERCSECGRPSPSTTVAAARSRARCTRCWIAGIAVLPVLLVGASLARRSEHGVNDVAAQLERLRQLVDERGTPLTRRIACAWTGRGWPDTIVFRQTDRWFNFTPGAEPVRATSTRRTTSTDPGSVAVEILREGGHRIEYVRVAWALIAAELALLWIATLPLLYLATRRRLASNEGAPA